MMFPHPFQRRSSLSFFCQVLSWVVANNYAQPLYSGRRRVIHVKPFVLRISMTLCETGRYANISKQIRQALLLLQDKVNEGEGYFQTSSKTKISMSLSVRDDLCDDQVAAELYRKYLDENETDVFLGPYGFLSTREAAREVVRETRRGREVFMAHNAPLQNNYDVTEGGNGVYSVDVPNGDLFNDGLEKLFNRGSRTLVLLQTTSEYYRDACAGVLQNALRIGYAIVPSTIKAPLNISIRQMTASIRLARAHNPDVVAGCVDIKDAIMLVITSQALGFNPKAMIIAEIKDDTFATSVRPINAEYIMSPVKWDAAMYNEEFCSRVPLPNKETGQSFDNACLVFNSSKEFHSLYIEKYKEEPHGDCASAVAGALTLMKAAEMADAPGPPEILIKKLNEIGINTIFGTIQFSRDNGTRVGKLTPGTFQYRKEDNYVDQDSIFPARVEPIFLENLSQLRYPMPNWWVRLRELEPCPLGHEINRSKDPRYLVKSDCVPCPRGRYRDQNMVSCRDCDRNMYTTGEKSAECVACATGANCTILADTGRVVAAAGWYQLQDAWRNTSLHECSPRELCLGDNRCVVDHVGILCASCHPGFGHGFDNECKKCPYEKSTIARIGLLTIGYAMFVAILAHFAHDSAYASTSLNNVVTRFFINYVHITAAVLFATDFMSRRAHQNWLILIVHYAVDPIPVFFSLPCVKHKLGMSTQSFFITIGIFMIPVIVLITICVLVVVALLNDSWCGHAEDPEDSQRNQTAAASHADSAASSSDIEGDSNANSSDDDDDDFGDTFQNTPSLQRYRSAYTREISDFRYMLECKCIRVTVIWVYILYPISVRTILTACRCVELDSARLQLELSVKCTHTGWRFKTAIVAASLVGCAVPGALLWLLRRSRRELDSMEVRSKYLFLFNGFEKNYYYFEVVYFLRKFLILCVIDLPQKSVRLILLTCLSAIFVGVHIRCQPFDNRGYFLLDRLEYLTLSCLIVPISAELFILFQKSFETYPVFSMLVRHPLFDSLTFFMAVLANVAFLFYIIRAVFWHLICKPLLFIDDCFQAANVAMATKCFTGAMGIDYDDYGVVKEVDPHGQAAKRKIQKDDLIVNVGTAAFSRASLGRAEKSGLSYKVTVQSRIATVTERQKSLQRRWSFYYCRQIMRWLASGHNYVKIDRKTNDIDISSLSSSEKHFFHLALSDTLACYVEADTRHVGQVVEANKDGGLITPSEGGGSNLDFNIIDVQQTAHKHKPTALFRGDKVTYIEKYDIKHKRYVAVKVRKMDGEGTSYEEASFYPGFIGAAVREAFKKIRRTRRHRIGVFLEFAKEHPLDPSWRMILCSLFSYWRGFLNFRRFHGEGGFTHVDSWSKHQRDVEMMQRAMDQKGVLLEDLQMALSICLPGIRALIEKYFEILGHDQGGEDQDTGSIWNEEETIASLERKNDRNNERLITSGTEEFWTTYSNADQFEPNEDHLDSDTKVTEEDHIFKPGEMGITYNDLGFVEGIGPDGQARTKRISDGDQIVKVGTGKFSKDAVVAAEKSGADYIVTFKVRHLEPDPSFLGMQHAKIKHGGHFDHETNIGEVIQLREELSRLKQQLHARNKTLRKNNAVTTDNSKNDVVQHPKPPIDAEQPEHPIDRVQQLEGNNIQADPPIDPKVSLLERIERLQKLATPDSHLAKTLAKFQSAGDGGQAIGNSTHDAGVALLDPVLSVRSLATPGGQIIGNAIPDTWVASCEEPGGKESVDKGSMMKIHFYDVETKTRSYLEYNDQKQIGDLLSHYSNLIGLRRNEIIFEIWEQEVYDTDTWNGLRAKHKLNMDDVINVTRR